MSLTRSQDPRSTHNKIIVFLHTRNKHQKWNWEDNPIYNRPTINYLINWTKILRLVHRKLQNCWGKKNKIKASLFKKRINTPQLHNLDNLLSIGETAILPKSEMQIQHNPYQHPTWDFCKRDKLILYNSHGNARDPEITQSILKNGNKWGHILPNLKTYIKLPYSA